MSEHRSREAEPILVGLSKSGRGPRAISAYLQRAIETGVVEVLRGRGNLLDRFASTFHLAA